MTRAPASSSVGLLDWLERFMVPTPSRYSFGFTGTAVRWESHRRVSGAGGRDG